MSRRFLFSMALAVAPWTAEAKGEETPLRVLFVGNSYTYTNDLPRTVEQLSAVHGRPIRSAMLASPNFAISDHFGNGVYQSVVDDGWDWVILQQGPSSLPENREHLKFWSKRAADVARSHGAQVALMSAWPALENEHTWRAAEWSYHEAAAFSDSCVLPVSTAWRLWREASPSVGLYQPDQLHPTEHGTLLAAITVVRGLDRGAYVATPPDAASALPEEPWGDAAVHAAAFDAVARAALAIETERCWRGK